MNTFIENSDVCSESEEEDEFNFITQSLAQYRHGTKGKDSETKDMNSMWYLTIESLGTALKIFAPAAILSWFYRHDTFIFRILQHCDKAIRSVLFQKSDNDDVISWLQDIFPYDNRARSLETVWHDGSIICDLVESVVPGSNERENKFEKNDFSHGQRLAEQYLGVNPIFSKEDLSNAILSKQQECRLTFYLNSIKDSLNRLSPPISRTGSPILNAQAYTLDYIARGMGLITASQNKKSSFYIYPTAQQGIEPGDISIQIKGPGGCYGSTLVPAIYGKTHIIRSVLMNFSQRKNSIPIHLPIPCGSSNVRKTDVCNENKNYFTSKISNDIEIRVLVKNDKVKVTYIPIAHGAHEVTLITKGCHVIGSPYRVYVESETENSKDSQDLEDEDITVDKIDKSDRKIVFKIVDFVTEKMLLTADGRLEKISSEDVETLLHTVESMENIAMKYLQCNQSLPQINVTEYDEDSQERVISKHNFNNAVKKVLLMLRICRELRDLPQANNSIPDIINSSIKDPKSNKCAKTLRSHYKSKHSSFNQASEDKDLDSQIETETIFQAIDPRAKTVYKENTPMIDIVVTSFDEDLEQTHISTLPERPKTPIYKILEDDDENISDPSDKPLNNDVKHVCMRKNLSLDISNEIIERNPQIDFHIGEPVTPTNLSSNINSDEMDSIILSSNLEEALIKYDNKIQKKIIEYEPYQSEDSNSSLFNTPLRTTPFEQMTDIEIIKMYEEQQPFSNVNHLEEYEERSYTIDSAYMSIDDVNTSPDTNTTNSSPRDKLFSIEENDAESEHIDPETYSKMGPAERELWESMENQFKSKTYPKIIQNQCSITPIDENEIYVKKHSNISTSDYMADAKSSEEPTLSNEHIISSVQLNNAEFEDVNCISSADESKNNSPKKTLSKMVSEKKEYWDDMIKSIEYEEVQQYKNIKIKTTNLRKNASLSQKRIDYTHSKDDIKNHSDSSVTNPQTIDRYTVANWKKYWNDKLEKTPSFESNTQYIHKKYLSSDEDYAGEFNEQINRVFELTASQDHENKLTKNLSNRIDEYLDSISNPTPTQNIESTFSTPDINEYKSLNDNNTSNKWNNNLNDEPKSMPATDFKSELESLPSIVNVKEKFENLNRVERARHSFLKNRSKTIDIPRISSFKKLQKYFSVDKLNNEDQIPKMSNLSKDINVKIENLSQIEREQSKSFDSLPTLAEKKARIEAHLISIQTKRKQCEENNNTNTVECDDRQSKNDSNDEIRTELEEIAKPIGALVAVFENKNALKKQENINRPEKISKKIIHDAVSSLDSNPTEDANNRIKPEPEEDINSDKYKERFMQAKMFFQGLGVRSSFRKKKIKPPNECEQLLIEKDTNKRVHKKISRKAYSAPVSDSETEYQRYIWKRHGKDKLLKISEKYLVEDLFKDIAGDSFGAFKGIPHKNAVLATFKSMENINQFPSYEYTKTQLDDFTIGSSNGDIVFLQNEPYASKCFTRDFKKLRRARRNSEPNLIR